MPSVLCFCQQATFPRGKTTELQLLREVGRFKPRTESTWPLTKPSIISIIFVTEMSSVPRRLEIDSPNLLPGSISAPSPTLKDQQAEVLTTQATDRAPSPSWGKPGDCQFSTKDPRPFLPWLTLTPTSIIH